MELLGPGEGEVISDRSERSLVIKAAVDEMTVALLRYEPGQRGPAPHVHREHADSFYVIEGRVVFELGDGEITQAEPSTFVVVPPNVVHSFRNEGPGTARFLVVHAPSCGFDDYLRALRDGRRSAAARFDQHDPPPDGGRPASDALIQPGAAAIDMVSLAETDVSQDEREHAAATAYWVLDGTLTVRAGDEELEAERDDFVLVPPGTAHTLAGPARVVTIAA